MKEEGKKKKLFDYCIGNPPYQGENHQQIYPEFYLAGKEISNCLELIFPTGWQEPKTANNLGKLNKKEIKEDKQIVFIDNRQNVFVGVPGAEWTNIIMWKNNYDNSLDGKQNFYVEGKDLTVKKILHDKNDIEKPDEIVKLSEIVRNTENFETLQTITSVLKPYGLRTDVIVDVNKYNLEPLQDYRINADDMVIYAKSGIIKYIPKDYKLPKKHKTLEKFKVLVPYAWGNMSQNSGLGGAFSDIIIAYPNELCTETYLTSGCFDDLETTIKHAKYLMTKFCRALLYMNKFSQHSTTAWGAVPIQDYSEDWWDKTIDEIDNYLFKKYNIPQNIREFIQKNIQTKNENNIINFKREME